MKPESRGIVVSEVINPTLEYCKHINPKFAPMLEGVLQLFTVDPTSTIPISTDVLFDFMVIAYAAGKALEQSDPTSPR